MCTDHDLSPLRDEDFPIQMQPRGMNGQQELKDLYLLMYNCYLPWHCLVFQIDVPQVLEIQLALEVCPVTGMILHLQLLWRWYK
jgi:hypothetical protein